MLTGRCIRGARGLLGWSAGFLAQKSKVGTATVLRIERHKAAAAGHGRTIERIERALNEAGVRIVVETNGAVDIHFDPELKVPPTDRGEAVHPH